MKRTYHLWLLLLILCGTAAKAQAETTSAAPVSELLEAPPPHVLLVGFDGWGGYSLAKAHDIPNIQSLMERGCYTLKKRAVLPSSSAVNWASMFNGSCPELHGYTEWNSQVPEIPSAEVNEHGVFPTIFSLLRKAYPDAVTGCLTEWPGIKHVVDTLAIDDYSIATNWEKDHEELCRMAEQFIRQHKPTLLAVCWDQLDHTGHTEGHDTPAYYQTLAELDLQVGRLIQALKQAGIYDDTIIILTADHHRPHLWPAYAPIMDWPPPALRLPMIQSFRVAALRSSLLASHLKNVIKKLVLKILVATLQNRCFSTQCL